MTALFSLVELRAQASRPGRAIDGGAAFTPVRDDALLALVEAAEAAIALSGATRGWRTMSDDAPANVLARALRRFKEAE
jgi:hypothetical protein